MEYKHSVSSNPHIRSRMTTQLMMACVVISLLPAFGFGVYNFGPRAALVVLVCIFTCVATEAVYCLLMKKKLSVNDLSAVVTGLLLGLNLPVSVPLRVPVIGSIFAILFVKQLFGGLGQNFMNPALGGRCFLVISFPAAMTNFATDVYTGATPLARLKAGESVEVLDMVVGRTGGTIGETSMIALLLGAVFLVLMGIIDLNIPGCYLASFVIFMGIFGGYGFDPVYLTAQLAGGGLMLGAFFMATDYVTRPTTVVGQSLFGIFLGILTGIFRVFGASAEGVSFAIIIGNLLVPLLEKWTRPTPFGKNLREFRREGRNLEQ